MSDFTLPLVDAPGVDAQRRGWLIATGAAGGAAAIATAVPFVASFAPSERAKALGTCVVALRAFT